MWIDTSVRDWAMGTWPAWGAMVTAEGGASRGFTLEERLESETGEVGEEAGVSIIVTSGHSDHWSWASP